MAANEIVRPCIVIKQGKYKLICFSASAKAMWNVLEINKRDSDKDKGYQRVLSTARIAVIAKYIDAENIIPNSILINLDKKSRLSHDGKHITIPVKKNAGWIIDGQHRLAGAKEARTEIDLIFIAFIGLSNDEQINQFVTINKEAKGVPTSLYYDLLKHLPAKKKEADWAKLRSVDIKDILNDDAESPFYKRIVVTSPQRGEMSLTNFVRKVTPLINKSGRLNMYSLPDQASIINNYFKSLLHSWPDEFKDSKNTFFKTLGFGAVMNVLPVVLDLCIKHYHGFTVEMVVGVFKHIDYFDFSAWDESGTGSAAEIYAGNELRTEIMKTMEPSDNPSMIQL
jgi:DGQHR domain-containing protein